MRAVLPSVYYTNAAVLSMIFAGSALAEPAFIGLGTLPGFGGESWGRAISADGSAVAGESGNSQNPRAFRWTNAGGMEDLGSLPGFQGLFGYSISSDGTAIAGTARLSFGHRAFRWTSAAGMENLGAWNGSGQTIGLAISGDGHTVAGWALTPSGMRPTLWTVANGLQGMDIYPYDGGLAYALSADGSAATGYFDSNTYGRHAFRWSRLGGTQDLGVLQGGGASYGHAISADGWVIAGESASDQGNRAFRWTGSTGMEDLGVPQGGQNSYAHAISGNGSAVAGYIVPFTGGEYAMLWTQSSGMVDLNTYLPSLGIDLTGWTLFRARGLSYDGSAMVGTGFQNGQVRAWVVMGLPADITPPPPPPPPCPDVSGDGQVNFLDITSILTFWGTTSAFGDANGDDTVNFADITAVLTFWGINCP